MFNEDYLIMVQPTWIRKPNNQTLKSLKALIQRFPTSSFFHNTSLYGISHSDHMETNKMQIEVNG